VSKIEWFTTDMNEMLKRLKTWKTLSHKQLQSVLDHVFGLSIIWTAT